MEGLFRLRLNRRRIGDIRRSHSADLPLSRSSSMQAVPKIARILAVPHYHLNLHPNCASQTLKLHLIPIALATRLNILIR